MRVLFKAYGDIYYETVNAKDVMWVETDDVGATVLVLKGDRRVRVQMDAEDAMHRIRKAMLREAA